MELINAKPKIIYRTAALPNAGQRTYLQCWRDHICWFAGKNKSCAICAIMDKAHNMCPIQKDYVAGQTSFEFVCGLGHRNLLTTRSDKSCRVCALMKTVQITHPDVLWDFGNVYITAHSRIRMRCVAQCAPPDTIPAPAEPYRCNQDFYATPWLLTHNVQIYNCSRNHWVVPSDHFRAVRILEIATGKRFDDVVVGLRFTGYNHELSLALVHDDKISQKDTEACELWCKANDVLFLHIPWETRRPGRLTKTILDWFVAQKILSADESLTEYARIRAYTKRRSHARKLYDDRCDLGRRL